MLRSVKYDHTIENISWLRVLPPVKKEEAFKPKTLWIASIYEPPKVKPTLPTPKRVKVEVDRSGYVTKQVLYAFLQERGKVTAKEAGLRFNCARKSVSNTLKTLVADGYATSGAERVGKRVHIVYTKTDKSFVEKVPMTQMILDYLKDHPGASADDLVKVVGRTRPDGGLIGNLRSRGLVGFTGVRRSTKYYLPEDMPEDVL